MWKTFTHVKQYQDPWITTWSDDMKFPNGHKSTYGYIEFADGVHAVVVDNNNRIVLFKQFRYAVRKNVWSIPGGKIEANETPEKAIAREIKEEINVEIDSLEKLGKTWHFCGAYIQERHYFFLAHTNQVPSNGGENNESIVKTKSFSINQVLKMIDRGEIEENSVANALQIAIRKINKNK